MRAWQKALEVAQPKTLIVYGGGFDDFDFGETEVIRLKANTAFNNRSDDGKSRSKKCV